MKHLYTLVKLQPQLRRPLAAAADPSQKAGEYRDRYASHAAAARAAGETQRHDPVMFRTLYNTSLAHRRVAVVMQWLQQGLAGGRDIGALLTALDSLSWHALYADLGLTPDPPLGRRQGPDRVPPA